MNREHSIPIDPDRQLVQAMSQGDARALDELYARHGPGVLSFLVSRLSDRQLAEEVLQDVMLAAWKNADGFRGESSVRTWLLVIARNRAINARRRYAPTLVSVDTVFNLQSTDTGPFEAVAREFDKAAVRDAIGYLEPDQREILTLFFYHQLSGPEIAEVLEINPGTVKSRLHRAKEALRRTMMLREGTDA
ncbi:MAG: sigma-70 family RNA polymerase sigma factor [Chloroflexi bacterium]|nr:sigma-70 family RNA polymerase sigma factor [Chloroflexota bacterium]